MQLWGSVRVASSSFYTCKTLPSMYYAWNEFFLSLKTQATWIKHLVRSPGKLWTFQLSFSLSLSLIDALSLSLYNRLHAVNLYEVWLNKIHSDRLGYWHYLTVDNCALKLYNDYVIVAVLLSCDIDGENELFFFLTSYCIQIVSILLTLFQVFLNYIELLLLRLANLNSIIRILMIPWLRTFHRNCILKKKIMTYLSNGNQFNKKKYTIILLITASVYKNTQDCKKMEANLTEFEENVLFDQDDPDFAPSLPRTASQGVLRGMKLAAEIALNVNKCELSIFI